MKPRVRIACDGGYWRKHFGGFGWMAQSGPWPSLKAAFEAPANFFEALKELDPYRYRLMQEDVIRAVRERQSPN